MSFTEILIFLRNKLTIFDYPGENSTWYIGKN